MGMDLLCMGKARRLAMQLQVQLFAVSARNQSKSFLTLASSPKPIIHVFVVLGMASLHGKRDSNVQVAMILLVGFALDFPGDCLSSANGQGLGKVENRLLPVCVATEGGRRKANRFVDLGKGTFEIGNQAMNVVVALCLELKGCLEVDVFLFACQNVEVQYRRRVGYDGLAINGIDNGLLESDILNGRHVKPVYVAPKVHSISLDLSILGGTNIHDSFVGKDNSIVFDQPFVASKDDTVQHGFVEQKVPHPFTNNHVHFGDGQLDLFDLKKGKEALEISSTKYQMINTHRDSKAHVPFL